MKKLIILPLLALFCLASLGDANAVVRVVDATGNVESDFPAFSSIEVDTASGVGDDNPGDFSLLFCATENQPGDDNFFNGPTPNGWSELDNTDCGLSGCLQGIWGKFLDTAGNVPTTCSWDDPHFVAVAGTFRYADVDTQNPIIDIACNTGSSGLATAPSIVAEPGSHVVRVVTFSVPDGFRCLVQDEEISFGSLDLCASSEIENVLLRAITFTDLEGGPTGEDTLELPVDNTSWRACTIGLRMLNPELRAIPAISEWGFIAVAAFMGIAGVWYLRRRRALDV